MTASVIRADARNLPLEDDSVDLIVTSPPYWGLRSYRDSGEHYDGQVGSEATPQEYVDGLVGMVDDEWRRVLKPIGSLWLNLGDKYAGSGGHNNAGISTAGSTLDGTKQQERTGGVHEQASRRTGPDRYRQTDEARAKSLLGLPWRIALALIDAGWILRSELVWSKPNGLPESVRDRVRRSHEQWFHFVLEPRYFSAIDEVREPHTGGAHYGRNDGEAPPGGMQERKVAAGEQGAVYKSTNPDMFNPLGRTPGSVWTIPSEPLLIPDGVREQLGLVDHFAAFPQEWPRRLILGWSPSGICETCGEGLRPIVDRKPMEWEPSGRQDTDEMTGPRPTSGTMIAAPETTILGYECACSEPGPTRPAIVLDPFGGTGTTAGVARMLGRRGISVDLSQDYCRLAKWRISHSGHFSKTEDRSWADRQTTLI